MRRYLWDVRAGENQRHFGPSQPEPVEPDEFSLKSLTPPEQEAVRKFIQLLKKQAAASVIAISRCR